MNEKLYSQILDSLAGDEMDGVDVAPRVLAQIQKGYRKMKPQMKWATAVLLVLIAFVVLFFTVPGVAAAVRRWFGYVPGVGLVREGQIRVLAAPVSMTREGITVTVKQVVLESDSITILYQAEGIPVTALIGPDSSKWCTKSMTPTLRFPGWVLRQEDMSYAEGGEEMFYKFSAVPPAGNDAVFVLPCLYNVQAGAVPEDWEIPLHFVPVPPGMTAYPVIEVATPTVPAGTETGQQTTVPELPGITLSIDRVIPMEDSYLIYATLHWEGTEYPGVDLDISQPSIRVLDAGGWEVPFEQVYDDATVNDWNMRRTTFAIKTGPIKTGGPLAIVIDSLKAQLPELDEKPSFTFDVGSNPQPMHTWEVNQDFQIGTYSLRVISVMNVPGGLMVSMASDTVLDAGVYDPVHPACGGGSGGENGQFSVSISFCDDVALSGPVTLEIGTISVRLAGPWQAQWTPPAP